MIFFGFVFYNNGASHKFCLACNLQILDEIQFVTKNYKISTGILRHLSETIKPATSNAAKTH